MQGGIKNHACKHAAHAVASYTQFELLLTAASSSSSGFYVPRRLSVHRISRPVIIVRER